MVAVRISPDYKTAVVAAPKYLKSAPAIERPEDLVRQSCLAYRMSTSGALLRWQFQRGSRQSRLTPLTVMNRQAGICAQAASLLPARSWRAAVLLQNPAIPTL